MTQPNRQRLEKFSKARLIDEIIGLQHLLEQQLRAAPGTGPEVQVQGIVSHRTGEPLVQMRAGEAGWSMTPAQTRQHALILLDAAVEAERDAATMKFLQSMDMTEQDAGAFLHGMREHRKSWFDAFRSQWGHIQVEEDLPNEQ